MLNFILLVIGFIPLVYGGNFLVEGASSLAKKYNVPNMVIGLTIVAFGTSMPEFIVNVMSSAKGANEIAMGNIVGSNMFNIAFILGLTAILKKLYVKDNTTWKEILLTIISALVVFFLVNDNLIDKAGISQISRADGLVMLMFFIIFLSYTFSLAKEGRAADEGEIKIFSKPKSIFMIKIGLALLMVGGKVIVTYAVLLARSAGISERIIGLTIVSIGTSLPELTTSVIAALKGNVDIAVGNITGSNLFNVFWILGASALINPIPLGESQIDIIMNIFISLLLFSFVFFSKERKLDRKKGIVFLIVYSLYIGYLIIGA